VQFKDFLGAELEVNSIDPYENATAHAGKPGTGFWSYMQMVDPT